MAGLHTLSMSFLQERLDEEKKFNFHLILMLEDKKSSTFCNYEKNGKTLILLETYHPKIPINLKAQGFQSFQCSFFWDNLQGKKNETNL